MSAVLRPNRGMTAHGFGVPSFSLRVAFCIFGPDGEMQVLLNLANQEVDGFLPGDWISPARSDKAVCVCPWEIFLYKTSSEPEPSTFPVWTLRLGCKLIHPIYRSLYYETKRLIKINYYLFLVHCHVFNPHAVIFPYLCAFSTRRFTFFSNIYTHALASVRGLTSV